jgi:hypothetical protein
MCYLYSHGLSHQNLPRQTNRRSELAIKDNTTFLKGVTMSLRSFDLKLEGKSQLHEPIVKLQGIQLNIWSVDGGGTWENKDVELDVGNKLDVFMSCKAVSGTGWKFTIQDNGNDKEIYNASGETGEPRGGDPTKKEVPNYSQRETAVNC